MRRLALSFLQSGVVLSTALTAGCFWHGVGVQVSQGPKPLGAVVDSFWQAHETNGESHDFMIYQHEWVGYTAQLNPAGQVHVLQIARRLGETPFPVVIEPAEHRPFDDREYTDKDFTDFNREKRETLELDRARRQTISADRMAEIDQARRQEIVQFLSGLGYPRANERVFIGFPYSRGIPAENGRDSFDQLIDNDQGAGFSGRGGFGGVR